MPLVGLIHWYRPMWGSHFLSISFLIIFPDRNCFNDGPKVAEDCPEMAARRPHSGPTWESAMYYRGKVVVIALGISPPNWLIIRHITGYDEGTAYGSLLWEGYWLCIVHHFAGVNGIFQERLQYSAFSKSHCDITPPSNMYRALISTCFFGPCIKYS